jgi:chorismate mutase
MRCQGIRGATTADENTAEAILVATGELLRLLVEANGLRQEHVGSAIFTVTPDLTAVFPARAAREMGWTDVPLLCAQEIPVCGDVQRCIRVLVLWNTEKDQSEIVHVYAKGARGLRPDLSRRP